MNEAAGIVKQYFDEQASVYSSWYRSDTPDGCAFLERKDRVIECVGAHAGVLLDVGCGSGVMSRELARVASKYIGVDVASGMVEMAKAAMRDLHNVQFYVGDATKIDLPDGSVDTICAIGLLEYLAEPETALREMRRVLRPGGRLVSSVPYRYAPWRLWEQYVYLPVRKLSAAVVPLRVPYQLVHRFYSVSEYGRLMARERFTLDRVEFYNFPVLVRPFDVLFPRLAAKAVQLASPMRKTPLKWFGTGFVAVSSRAEAKKR